MGEFMTGFEVKTQTAFGAIEFEGEEGADGLGDGVDVGAVLELGFGATDDGQLDEGGDVFVVFLDSIIL